MVGKESGGGTGSVVKNKKPKRKLPYAFPLSVCLHDPPAWMPTTLVERNGEYSVQLGKPLSAHMSEICRNALEERGNGTV